MLRIRPRARAASAGLLVLCIASSAVAQDADEGAPLPPPQATPAPADPESPSDEGSTGADPAEPEAPLDPEPANEAPPETPAPELAAEDSTAASAEETVVAAVPVVGTALPPLQFHGFVSQGFIFSTGNNFFSDSKDDGSFEFNEAALNATVAPSDTFSASLQLFSRDLGPIGDYTIRLDWFQLDWKPRDEFGLRVGRTRMPFGLYNDTSDYDPGRVSILLPQSIYPLRSRDFLLAVTGAQVYGTLDLGAPGYLEYRAFGGTLFIDDRTSRNSPVPVTFEVPYAAGGRLMWETPVEGLRLGGSILAVELEGNFGAARYSLPAILWIASAEYSREKLLLAAEYSRTYTDLTSTDSTVLPPSDSISESYYVLSTYEAAPWLRLGGYYSGRFNRVGRRDDSQQYQHDVAATLRFDINPNWLLKLEGHFMHGTGIVTSDVESTPPDERPENWGVILVKTSAFF